MREAATVLFSVERTLPTASRVSSLRPLATVMLACDAAARAGMVGEVTAVYQRVGNALGRSFEGCQANHAWPWPEERSTTY